MNSARVVGCNGFRKEKQLCLYFSLQKLLDAIRSVMTTAWGTTGRSGRTWRNWQLREWGSARSGQNADQVFQQPLLLRTVFRQREFLLSGVENFKICADCACMLFQGVSLIFIGAKSQFYWNCKQGSMFRTAKKCGSVSFTCASSLRRSFRCFSMNSSTGSSSEAAEACSEQDERQYI